MAQPIRPAQVQMDLVSASEGMTGMRRTAAPPGAQQFLDPASSPVISNQPGRQMQLAQQTMLNRGRDAMQQYSADATRQSDEALRASAQAQQKAREMRNDTVAQILDGAGAPAMGLLLGQRGMAERATRDAMQQQAIMERMSGGGINNSPDLADYAGQLMA